MKRKTLKLVVDSNPAFFSPITSPLIELTEFHAVNKPLIKLKKVIMVCGNGSVKPRTLLL